jgi:anti-anti-sigma factor
MSVDVDVSGSVAVVTVAGECDTSEAGRLAEALQSALAQATEIQVELSGLTFLDSGALRVLYRAAADLDGVHKRLVVIGATPGIRRVLEIARLDSCLEIRESARDSAPRLEEVRPSWQTGDDRSQVNAPPAMSDAV